MNQADQRLVAEFLEELANQIKSGAMRVTWFSSGLCEDSKTGGTYEGLNVSYERT